MLVLLVVELSDPLPLDPDWLRSTPVPATSSVTGLSAAAATGSASAATAATRMRDRILVAAPESRERRRFHMCLSFLARTRGRGRASGPSLTWSRLPPRNVAASYTTLSEGNSGGISPTHAPN